MIVYQLLDRTSPVNDCRQTPRWDVAPINDCGPTPRWNVIQLMIVDRLLDGRGRPINDCGPIPRWDVTRLIIVDQLLDGISTDN